MAARRRTWMWLILIAALLAAGGVLKGLAAVPSLEAAAQYDPARDVGRLSFGWLRREKAVTIYFAADRGRYLVPVTRYVSGEDQALTVLKELLQGPGRGAVAEPSVPSGVAVQGFSVQDGLAAVQLGGAAAGDLASAGPNGRLARAAIVHSLTGLPGIDRVRIKLPDGTEIGPLQQPQWINPETPPPAGEQQVPLTLYFQWRGLLIPVTRWVSPTADPPLAALQETLRGPGAGSGLEAVPPGVQLQGVQVGGGMAKVRLRFSPELLQRLEAGVWRFSSHHMTIIYTLTEFPEIRRVQFDIEGLSATALGQCQTPLRQPLARPVEL